MYRKGRTIVFLLLLNAYLEQEGDKKTMESGFNLSVFMPHGGKNTKKPLSFTNATFVPAVIRESVCIFLL